MPETSDTPAKTPDPAAAQEVAGLLAHLASNLPEGAQKRQLTGPERAAILMLALGEEHGSRVWNLLDDTGNYVGQAAAFSNFSPA